MAKQRRKDPGLWERFMNWVDTNQKILWVLLLAAISFTFAFPQAFTELGGGDPPAAVIYGREVTRGELQDLSARLSAVLRLRPQAALRSEILRAGELDPREFLAYLWAAKRRGLQISDAELGAVRRDLWRQITATVRAQDQLKAEGIQPKPNAQGGDWEYTQQFVSRRAVILEQMEATNEFDVESWGKLVTEPRGRLTSLTIEETLRDVLLVARLEDSVKATVTVTDEEVYDRFREQEEQRRLTWAELEITEDFVGKVKDTLSDEDVTAHYDQNEQRFERDVRLAFDYLVVPREHFAEQVRGSVTEDELREAYDKNRHLYLRPAIRPDEGIFDLLSPEEKKARDEQLYLPFEEVRDRVEEKYVLDRSYEKLRNFGNDLKRRLFPPAAAAEAEDVEPPAPATFQELAEEYSFVTTKRTPPTEESESKEAFAEAYDSGVISGWYRTLRNGETELSPAQRRGLEEFRYLYQEVEDATRSRDPENIRALVFYANVTLSGAEVPDLDAIRDEVVEDLARLRAAEIVSRAAKEDIEQAASSTFADFTKHGIEVELEGGDKTVVRALEPMTSSRLVRRRWGSVMYLKRETEDGESSEEEKEEAEDVPSEERHPASDVLRDTGFAMETVGKPAVALDEENRAVYLVAVDAVAPPDPSRFETMRGRIAQELLQEKQTQRFDEWRRPLLNEAFGAELARVAPRVPDTTT